MLTSVREMVSFLWPQSSQFSLQRKHKCISQVLSIICEWQGCTKIHKHPSASTKKSRRSYGRKEKHPEMHREHGAWSAVSAGVPSIHCSREKQPVGTAEKLFSSPPGAFKYQRSAFLKMLPKLCSVMQLVSRSTSGTLFVLKFGVWRSPRNQSPKLKTLFQEREKMFSLLIRWNC